jgi:hypothetical protein
MKTSDEDNLHSNLSVNATTIADPIHNSIFFIEVVSVLYIVGIVGSFSAMLHLYRKRNYKNTKQAFMLK